MIIKEKKYQVCSKCGDKRLVENEEYGCDYCNKHIDPAISKEYLSMTVFYHEGSPDNLHCCSWECVFRKLREIKTDDFISLPYLSAEAENEEMSIIAFWKAIKSVADGLI